MEDDYRAYRGVIAAGIQVLRPHMEVASCGLEALEEELGRLEPQVVICTLAATAVGSSGSSSSSCGESLAWVELSLDPVRPTLICVGGRYTERTNPGLDGLLAVIDEVEELIESEEEHPKKRGSKKGLSAKRSSQGGTPQPHNESHADA